LLLQPVLLLQQQTTIISRMMIHQQLFPPKKPPNPLLQQPIGLPPSVGFYFIICKSRNKVKNAPPFFKNAGQLSYGQVSGGKTKPPGMRHQTAPHTRGQSINRAKPIS
jgi:hypothetical protein